VLNQGRVVEQGLAKQVIRAPRDTYTRKLLEAIPTLDYHVGARSGYVPAEEAVTAAE
jgi:peptide/nickel transport system ATP-binding protein